MLLMVVLQERCTLVEARQTRLTNVGAIVVTADKVAEVRATQLRVACH